jgi:hypothetical protein
MPNGPKHGSVAEISYLGDPLESERRDRASVGKADKRARARQC